ncbi:putative oxygen-independent coproporphyrinogen III oxidase [Marvinbryantia formatexigens DSM 14469]|uniref:Heme chaperone HemW n=1 Tax=Marvinbryantia formatexigens DSM 14469 TaxID=478749 RepID=C6LGI7_9FIRM|nr:radical SAM family heme chaperone HemW [Marvinbryantia formatexigens]EET60187.1 putative oxygen-independent coproporphyrinogen III oxidase [Marvinbryantia formatexigens DSM 14469]UWO24215.1 radical SAM family heme chaperone HemW [Marvinbryantia formatexigens DSM 14469]SDF59377.1 oxygen-independent coproporphyrinogen-3 oxidase [Marvinbryantia formatexigens]
MRPLQIYIHIPFCVRKCAYCDFLSFAADQETQRAYIRMLLREIEAWQDRGDEVISTVFFGGGTPSVLPAEEITLVMEALKKKFSFAGDAEITLECNPGTLTAEGLSRYRRAGINRLSIGLQSAQDKELRLLGRIHTWEEFEESYRLARAAGFANINVDLMSALPGQSPAAWRDTLEKVLALAPEHISAYSLIIEEGTPFYERYREDAQRRERGEVCRILPSEEEEREMYWMTEKLLKERGYERYEISNYAQPGFACRHNCGYWERREYLGFGLGAASLMDHTRFADTASLQQYLDGRWRGETQGRLTRAEEMEETMFLGLRLRRGVSFAHFYRTFGVTMEEIYGEVLQRLERQRLLERTEERIFLTKRGTDISNYVCAEFLF